jgi:hypothetical protein
MRKSGVALFVAAASLLNADEGLWPYNLFPAEAVKQKYAFDASTSFLENLRLASVRIGTAGSGSFVSPHGLLLTTRQMVNACLPNLQEAFSGERRCTGLEATVLLNIEDVTAQLKAATSVTQRNASAARIESDCAAKTGNVCSVVQLFSGGRYDLYRYQRYSDLRVVFAPEYSVAFFGKERDSISYLRYGLNIAFLRAYENNIPANTPHYLKWSKEGVKEDDLVFAAGNPGATSRSVTAAQLTFYRDTALPIALSRAQRRLQKLNAFAAVSDENMRAAQPFLTPLLNSFKSNAGKLIGLRDDRLVTRKTVFEQKIRRAVEGDPRLGAPAAKVWDEVAAAYKKWAPFEKAYQILESPPAPGPHANGAIDAIDAMMLTQYVEDLKSLGDKTVPLKSILQAGTSGQSAEDIVRLIEPAAQRLRKQHEEIIGSLEVSAAEKIAQYRFRLFGAAESPDGTGTPRIEFGVVTGYTDRAAVAQPFASTIGGLFYRQGNDGPWQVPPAWTNLRAELNPVTPLDFVSTCDTGGGDYGSPVVNRAGELVGVTFDGNLESLPNIFLYTSEQARAVHVDIRGIAEALEKVYKATPLLEELGIGVTARPEARAGMQISVPPHPPH